MDMGRVIKITTILLQNGYEYEEIGEEQTAVTLKEDIALGTLHKGNYLQTVKDLKDKGLGVSIDPDYDRQVFKIKVF